MRDGDSPFSPSGPAEAVALLRDEGFGDSIEVSVDGIWCAGCHQVHLPSGIVQQRIFRFEGASNPDDMSIVVGLRCLVCGRTGVVVSAFGPDADPRLFDILNQIPSDLGAHDPTT